MNLFSGTTLNLTALWEISLDHNLALIDLTPLALTSMRNPFDTSKVNLPVVKPILQRQWRKYFFAKTCTETSMYLRRQIDPFETVHTFLRWKECKLDYFIAVAQCEPSLSSEAISIAYQCYLLMNVTKQLLSFDAYASSKRSSLLWNRIFIITVINKKIRYLDLIIYLLLNVDFTRNLYLH